MAPMVKSLSLVSACVASILVPLVLATNAAHASMPTDEVFAPAALMTLPTGPTGCNYPPPYASPAPCKPLQSFDIGYVDEATHTYLLADRSNAAIDVFDTLTNSFVKFLQPTQPFAGALSGTGTAGPNGVILITGALKPPSPSCGVGCGPVFGNGKPVSLVWATYAPTSGTSGTSAMKVMDLASGVTVKVLNTLGVRRADELCFVTLPSGAPDPANPYVLVANDNTLDNYLTIWRWDTFGFVQRISLAGSDPLAAPYNMATGGKGANGIEQCKFNPRNKSFYLAVPATQGSPVTTLTAITTAGTGYTAGTYNNVPLTDVTGTGTGATANITVGAAVTPGGIASLKTLVGGDGYVDGVYTNVPLTCAPCGGAGAGATANITVTGNGAIATFGTPVPFTPGSGYTPGPYLGVALTGGSGSGASLNLTVANGVLNTQSSLVGGTLYTTGSYKNVSLTGGTGTGATANITVAAGAVTAVALVNRGSGYLATDTLSATAATIGGTGSGFTVQFSIVNGGVNTIALASAGTGYTDGDVLGALFIPGGGSGFSVKVATSNAVTAVTLVKSGSGYLASDTLSASNANLGGSGSGFTTKISALGGPVITATLVNGGFGYAMGDILSAAASSIGGTGSGFTVTVNTVNTSLTTDGFVLRISLPKQPTPWTALTACAPGPHCQYAKVINAYDIDPTTVLGSGCGVKGKGLGPAGLSIGPSLTGANLDGLIALGCGLSSPNSLIINDNYTVSYPVPLPQGTDETWYDPATNHFFFAQGGGGATNLPLCPSPPSAPNPGCVGYLGVVDANGYPPRSYVQEDGDVTGGPPVQDTPPVVTATGSHSVAVFPGTCGSSPTPTRPSRVYVPYRSTLTVPNNGGGFCAPGALPTTGPAPIWPGGTTQAPTATTWDEWGCIAVLTAPTSTCTSTGHPNPSP